MGRDILSHCLHQTSLKICEDLKSANDYVKSLGADPSARVKMTAVLADSLTTASWELEPDFGSSASFRLFTQSYEIKKKSLFQAAQFGITFFS